MPSDAPSIHDSSSPAFFEELYQSNPDPWNFAADTYEQSRYDAVIAALSHRRYHRAVEPGCSIGVLTERLAALCDHIYAVDFSPSAADSARKRCALLPNVTVACASLADCLSIDDDPDLFVLSEIGYYFEPPEWAAIVDRIAGHLRPGAIVLAAHWLGHSDDHTGKGEQVHEILRANPKLSLEHEQRFPAFRLDRFVRL